MNRDVLEESIIQLCRAYELAEHAPSMAHKARIMEHTFRGVIALHEASKWQPVGTAKFPIGDVLYTDGERVWAARWPGPAPSATHAQALPGPSAKKES